MRAETQIGQIPVHWRYDDKQIETKCTIKLGDQVIGEASLRRWYADPFIKNTGRKRTLTLALKKTDIDKDNRKKIWEEYYKMRHNKW